MGRTTVLRRSGLTAAAASTVGPTPGDTPAILVHDLHKSYGRQPAVRGISFAVERGTTFALLGPNGAGKTTTIEILEGYRKRDAGTAKVLGQDPSRFRRSFRESIGVVLQHTALEPELTVLETVRAFARLYRQPLAPENVLGLVDLGNVRPKRVRALSGGQKRRLDIALALVGNPSVLFLDEPTSGLDPEARRRIWDLVVALNAHGKTILLSSHNMAEVCALADRIAILVDGVIRAEGAPSELRERFGAYTEIRFYLGSDSLPESYPRALWPLTRLQRGWAILRVPNPVPVVADLANWAFRIQIPLAHLEVMRPTLEDIYLELTSSAPGETST